MTAQPAAAAAPPAVVPLDPALVDAQPEVDALGRKARVRRSVQERFLSKVDLTGDCWEWTGNRTPSGYGTFYPTRTTKRLAHRVAYELFVGPIPDGLELDHLCRNRACVRPEHLEPVSHRENTLRGDAPPARNAKKTACSNGHPYDGVDTRGHRICSLCTAAREARRVRTRAVRPLDPRSPRGKQAAADLSDVLAGVITRLQSEGKPVPHLAADPAP